MLNPEEQVNVKPQRTGRKNNHRSNNTEREREWGRKVVGKRGSEGNIFTDIHGLSPL